MLEFTIPLPPTSWQAPKLSRFHCYDPKESEKRAVRYLLKQQYNGDLLKDYVILNFYFQFKIPKSYTKKQIKLAENKLIFPTRHDCTNMQKLYEDCLKGTVIEDDRYVINISSSKSFGEKDEVKIFLKKWEKSE